MYRSGFKPRPPTQNRRKRLRERKLGFTPAEAARAFGLHETTIYLLIKTGRVPVVRPRPRSTWLTNESIGAMVALGYKLRI